VAAPRSSALACATVAESVFMAAALVLLHHMHDRMT
jgi:hypothetical protein